MAGERRWSLEEANATLPWLGERIEAAREALAAARSGHAVQTRAIRSNGHGSMPADLTPVREIVDEIQGEGIVIRDLDQGLVDFPADTAAGRTYLLCWLVGEPEITWWHWPEDGFAGRAPLSAPPE